MTLGPARPAHPATPRPRPPLLPLFAPRESASPTAAQLHAAQRCPRVINIVSRCTVLSRGRVSGSCLLPSDERDSGEVGSDFEAVVSVYMCVTVYCMAVACWAYTELSFRTESHCVEKITWI